MSSTVSYKGSQLTVVSNATKILETAGAYLEDDITIVDVPASIEHIASLSTETIALSDTAYATWTPSTTAGVILSTADAGTFVATNIADIEYLSRVRIYLDVVYESGASTAKGMFSRMCGENWYSVDRRASNRANLDSGVRNSNVAESISNTWVIRYYNTAWTAAYNSSYGIYPGNSAPTFSSSTAASPTVTVKRPVINAKCSSTYFSTTMAGKIDQENSSLKFVYDIYRIDGGFQRKILNESLMHMWNNGL